jgi:alpha-N-arabinofuranosidase
MGKIRTEMGHPKPFNLKFIGVEMNSGEQIISNAIKYLKKPFMQNILTSKSFPEADRHLMANSFEYGWKELKKLNAQIVDEHYYNSPEWFMKNAGRYDKYDRSGQKFLPENMQHNL